MVLKKWRRFVFFFSQKMFVFYTWFNWKGQETESVCLRLLFSTPPTSISALKWLYLNDKNHSWWHFSSHSLQLLKNGRLRKVNSHIEMEESSHDYPVSSPNSIFFVANFKSRLSVVSPYLKCTRSCASGRCEWRGVYTSYNTHNFGHSSARALGLGLALPINILF